MARKTKNSLERERIAASIAKELSSDGGGYSLSSATSVPLKVRLSGNWGVVSHEVGGEPYIERIATRSLKDIELQDIEYRVEYTFKEHICIKRVDIDGRAELPDGSASYQFRQRMALSWDLDGPERLRVMPELGFQHTSLDDIPAAIKEMEDSGDYMLILFRLDGDELVLEEGDDIKRLRRLG